MSAVKWQDWNDLAMCLTSWLLFKVKEFMCWGSTVPENNGAPLPEDSGQEQVWQSIESTWNQSMTA